jgi:hypothetical protein
MKPALSLVLIAALVAGVAARQKPDSKPPVVPADLIATSRIPALTLRVTDPDGNPPAVPVYVNWRNLTDGLSGVGRAVDSGQFAGQFNITNRLVWSAARGWQLSQVGPHRIEIVAEGFKTWVADSIDLQPGLTHRLDVVLERRGPKVLLDPETYTRLAAEHLLKSVKAAKGATGQIRALGPPVLLPDHARVAARNIPEAFVVATIYVNGKFRESAVVTFSDGVPSERLSYPSYPPDGTGFLPLEEQEWKTMFAAVGDFYAVAADVTRGPERFYPYLPENMHRMLDLRGEKNRMFLTPEALRTLSNDQLRRFVALSFDAMTLSVWLVLHGLYSADVIWHPSDVRRDPVGVIAALETRVTEARRMLESAGVLNVAGITGSQMYVRRLLGEGYMVRENPDRDGVRNLPRGARMYTVLLGGPLPHVTLDKEGLKIVAVDYF